MYSCVPPSARSARVAANDLLEVAVLARDQAVAELEEVAPPHAELPAPAFGDLPVELQILVDAASRTTGAIVKKQSDTAKALATAARRIDAVYEAPFLAHVALEPLSCTVHVRVAEARHDDDGKTGR